MKTLSIIVVSFNTQNLTLACINSIYQQSQSDLFEVIVVDNNSSDASAREIKTSFPQVNLIALDTNIGFARANNLAIKQAQGSYILLLNPDTVVLDHAIDRLIAFAQNNADAGIWGGRTLFADHSLNPTSCWAKPTVWSLFCRALHLSFLFPKSYWFNPEAFGGWKHDTVKQVDIVTGCFLLIKKDIWNQLDGFDKDFFMYGEEADLCLRARKFGCRPIVTPEATIIHYGGASEQSKPHKLIKVLTAKVMLIKKHWNPVWVPVGLFLLRLWVVNKVTTFKILNLFCKKSKNTDLLATWSMVLKHKNQWLSGIFTDDLSS